jgi:hypothetical protein
VAAVKASFNIVASPLLPAPEQEKRYVFAYDADTIAELEDTMNRQTPPTPSTTRRPRT